MNTCGIHTKFFDDACTECKKEYAELKGIENLPENMQKGYILICYYSFLKTASIMKSKLQKKEVLPLENSAGYEICNFGLGFD
jgi:hypothetical protein